MRLTPVVALLVLAGCGNNRTLEETRICADIGLRYYTHVCPYGAEAEMCFERPYFQVADVSAPAGGRSCLVIFGDRQGSPKVRLFDFPKS